MMYFTFPLIFLQQKEMLTERLNLKGKALQYVALCSGTGCLLSGGFHLGWTAPYLPQLLSNKSPIPITDNEGSWIAISLLIGGFFGSGSSCLVLDRYGRKNLILFTSLPYLLSWFMIAFATSMWELCIARFLAGISNGIGFCVMPLYLAEIADADVRGLFLSGLEFMVLLGVLVISIVGSYLGIETFAFISLSVPLAVFITFMWLPETPHYYVLKGEIENAKDSLQRFSGKMDVEDRLGHILESLADCQSSKSKLVNFFTIPSSRRGIYMLLLLRGVQQFSGTIAFTFYLPTILENAQDFLSPTASTAIYYTLQMLFAFITMIIIDKVGRKPLLIFSVVVVSISLSMVGIYFSVENLSSVNLNSYTWIPLLGLFLFIAGFSSGLHCVPLLYVMEMFPIGVKVVAVAVYDIYFCIMSSVASKFFQYTKDEFGMHVPFLTFAICCISSLPFIISFVSETKTKTLEEIQIENKSQNTA